MKKTFTRLLSLTLSLAILFTASACFESHSRELLPDDDVTVTVPDNTGDEFNALYSAFSAELLSRATELTDEENVVVSPISLLAVLTMVAKGAEGETLAQFEEFFGMPLDEYSENIGAYLQKFNATDQANTANSIWIKDTFEVEQAFINDCGRHFSPDIYVSPFDDTTLDDINHWADEKSDGLIKKIIEEIGEDAIMYLMNAVLFDAKWEEKYEKSDIVDRTFTNASGEGRKVKMLFSEESKYIAGEDYVGFAKDYEGGEYSFVALLPDEGITPEALLLEIGDELYEVLNSSVSHNVEVYMPRFKAENSLMLKEILMDMGLTDVFTPLVSDLSGISVDDSTEPFLSGVLQKTYIELDENGTKAAAITIGFLDGATSAMVDYIVLDRPYVYAIVHNETGLPVFVGITNNAQ